MKKSVINFSFIILLLFSGNFAVIIPEAVSEKAKYKRAESLAQLVYLETPLENFGTDEEKKTYIEIKQQYTKALTFYFEDDFLNAYRNFLEIQVSLEKLFEGLSLNYINRTAQLLQDAAQVVVDINIKYNNDSQKVRRFRQSRDLTTKTPEGPAYDTKEFHFYYDRKPIMNNLDKGFERLGQAKMIRQQAMDLEKYLENNKKMSPRTRAKRISNYMAVITLCRDAKLNGVMIFQLLQRNKVYAVQKNYSTNRFAFEKGLNPVFDLRIPEKYRIDANDSYKRLHKVETCLKLDLKKPTECNIQAANTKKK